MSFVIADPDKNVVLRPTGGGILTEHDATIKYHTSNHPYPDEEKEKKGRNAMIAFGAGVRSEGTNVERKS